jgi:hypothetical protein
MFLLYLEIEEDSACLECIMAPIVSFSIAGMCHGQNCPFQHGWKPGTCQVNKDGLLKLSGKSGVKIT